MPLLSPYRFFWALTFRDCCSVFGRSEISISNQVWLSCPKIKKVLENVWLQGVLILPHASQTAPVLTENGGSNRLWLLNQGQNSWEPKVGLCLRHSPLWNSATTTINSEKQRKGVHPPSSFLRWIVIHPSEDTWQYTETAVQMGLLSHQRLHLQSEGISA